MFEVSFLESIFITVSVLFGFICLICFIFSVYLSYCACFPFTPNVTKWWQEPVFLWVPDSIDGMGPGFLWIPDSIEGGGCFSVGEFLFHRVIDGDSWLLIFVQPKSMQTNVKQRRKNHNESKDNFKLYFLFWQISCWISRKQSFFLSKLRKRNLMGQLNIEKNGVHSAFLKASTPFCWSTPPPLYKVHKPNLGHVQVTPWEMSKHVGSDSIGGIPQKCGIKSVPRTPTFYRGPFWSGL